MATYLDSQRGRKKLIFENFEYIQEKTAGNKIYWQCSRKSYCRARAHTMNGEVIKIINEHTHPPLTSHMLGFSDLTENAQDTSSHTQELPEDVLEKLSFPDVSILPDVEIIDGNVNADAPKMIVCDPLCCEHLVALNQTRENLLAIQIENLDLKKKLLIWKSRKTITSRNDIPVPNKNDERLREVNKENQELVRKLVDSKQMVAELKPQIKHVLQSIQNIEQALVYKKTKQVRDDPKSVEEQLLANGVSISTVQKEGNMSVNLSVENERASSRKEETSDYNVNEQTQDYFPSTNLLVTSFSGSDAPSSSQYSLTESPDPDGNTFEVAVDYGLENCEEEPMFSECSICHKAFQNYVKPELKEFLGPPCCDRCKVPQAPRPNKISFHYPNVNRNSSTCSDVHSEQDSSDLAVQYAGHVDNTPYQCQICGKKFAQAYCLNRHTRVHTGEKPYTCKICGKSFSVSGRLTLHLRTHTGDKPFRCKFCGKRFYVASKLKAHYRKHTGEKPFVCEVCDKGFTEMSTLRNHCKQHLSQTQNKCVKCGNGFRTSNDLRVHNCLQICDS